LKRIHEEQLAYEIDTLRTTATVPGGLEPSGIWKTALCLFGSNGSFAGSNFSTPYFLNT
jgi:hypothetical protein